MFGVVHTESGNLFIQSIVDTIYRTIYDTQNALFIVETLAPPVVVAESLA